MGVLLIPDYRYYFAASEPYHSLRAFPEMLSSESCELTSSKTRYEENYRLGFADRRQYYLSPGSSS